MCIRDRGNEHRGNEGAEQTGDEVGAVLFQYLAVRHDGAGQVGKVSLAEKGQRQLSQPLRKGQAAGAALFIGCLLYTSIPEEINLSQDVKDYPRLLSAERSAYDKILSFLVFLDSIQTCLLYTSTRGRGAGRCT